MADGVVAERKPIPPLSVDAPEAKSADTVAANLDVLRALFPDAFSEGKIDFEVLRQLLGDAVDEGEEKYGLNWSGKRQARRLALTPSAGTLLPLSGDSENWDTTKNLMIEGDNLEVLKLLQKSYAGTIKLIYIDPPYNTGSDFVYPDDYVDSISSYLQITGQCDGGRSLTSNPETSGRFHTEWLRMVYPRLMLARELMSPDGFMFVSCDDHEVANLKSILAEIFSDEDFFSQIVVQSNKRGQTYKDIAKTHEYVLCYGRGESSSLFELPKEGDSLPFVDSIGSFDLWELRNRNPKFGRHNRPNLFYPIYVCPDRFDDNGYSPVSLLATEHFRVEVLPRNSEGKDSCWRWGKDKLTVENKSIMPAVVARQRRDGQWNVYEKSRKSTTKPKSIWDETAVINEQGTTELSKLGMAAAFDHPKPVALVKKIVEIATEADDLVLDFFAGSGTTGHAVMAQNAADGGARRYILVQLPEPIDPANEEQRVAADFCDKLGKPRAITELTKERLRRAASKVAADNPEVKFDGGFRVYKLATSNLKAWNPGADLAADLLDAANNLLPGRTDDDLLVELLLKRGIDLAEPSLERTIAGRVVHAFGGGVLVVCLADVSVAQAEALADGVADWIIKLEPAAPAMVIFKDAGFENDVAKTNVDAILRQRLNGRAPDPARGGKLPELLLDVRSV